MSETKSEHRLSLAQIRDPDSIFGKRLPYKPMPYQWAHDYFIAHEQAHWTRKELQLTQDRRDFENMTQHQRDVITRIMQFFTQGDIDVGEGYIEKIAPIFKQIELRMMIGSIIAREAVHTDAYALLNETLNLPDEEYSRFIEIAAMRKKHEYAATFNPQDLASKSHWSYDDIRQILKTIIAGGFTEGVQLFSSFAILLSLTLQGVAMVPGMGTVVDWSMRDETMHVYFMSALFKQIIREYPRAMTDELVADIARIAMEMAEIEYEFLDYVFGDQDLQNLTKDEMKQYVRHMTDRRLVGFGFEPIYGDANPIPWVDDTTAASITNYFELRATEYTKGAIDMTERDSCMFN